MERLLDWEIIAAHAARPGEQDKKHFFTEGKEVFLQTSTQPRQGVQHAQVQRIQRAPRPF